MEEISNSIGNLSQPDLVLCLLSIFKGNNSLVAFKLLVLYLVVAARLLVAQGWKGGSNFMITVSKGYVLMEKPSYHLHVLQRKAELQDYAGIW